MAEENYNYCVYVHISPSGKMYVGQTGKKPKDRWGKNGNNYLRKRNGEYTQKVFAHAILKYGWDNFDHEIIASNLTKEEADNFERLLIKKLNTMDSKYGYNSAEGGSRSGQSEETRAKISKANKGKVRSEKFKEKIRKARIGKHLSEETKRKISEARKGSKHAEETKKKISEANMGEKNHMYGKTHSKESLNKMSESHKGKLVGANHPNAKKIVQYDKDGSFIRVWDCMRDASRELNIHYGSIYDCCRGNERRKTAGGFIWKHYDDIESEVA